MNIGPEKTLCYSLCRTLLIVIQYFAFLMHCTDFYYQVVKDPDINNSFLVDSHILDRRRRQTIVTTFFIVNLIQRLVGLIVISVENLFITIVYTIIISIVLYFHLIGFSLDFCLAMNSIITLGCVFMSYLLWEDQKSKPKLGYKLKAKI